MSEETGSTPATQKDVAKALGISQATVSFALKGDPKISESRREEILEAARSLGYRPSPAASSLAQLRHSKSKKTQGEVFGWLNLWKNPKDLNRKKEFHQYFLGAKAAADSFGFRLDEFNLSGNLSQSRLGSILTARGIEGILLPPHPFENDFEGINWSTFSLIRIGHSIDQLPVNMVSSDQVNNTILAYRKIRERGYKRIGFIYNPSKHWLFDAGFLKAQMESPVKDRIPILFWKNDDLPRMKELMKKWLINHKPDAIFTTHPPVPSLLNEMGYKVPDDIGVSSSSIRDVEVDSGIDQNPVEIGRASVVALITQMHDNERGIPLKFKETLIKGTWVDGNSLPPRS
jgi:DNA-binding LacI/PurR family transcriptional regulator